jgi:tRNA threonylcarbamoyladenosine biosynthesis protein TsaE
MTAEPAATASQSGERWLFISHSEADTEALGQSLGRALEQGGIVALIGPLGAGKTRLVQSIAAAIGADRRTVNSPTFILIQEYAAPLPLFHCDTYRLRNVDEFLDLGVDEMFQSGGVCLIEWADRVAEVLPSDRLQIEIEVLGATDRQFTLTALGPRSAGILEQARELQQVANRERRVTDE